MIFITCTTSDLQVREIASDPDEYNTFVTTFDDIQDIVLDIQGILCDRTLMFLHKCEYWKNLFLR